MEWCSDAAQWHYSRSTAGRRTNAERFTTGSRTCRRHRLRARKAALSRASGGTQDDRSPISGDAGGFFVPGLSLVTLAANYGAASTIGRHIEEQSGRVSLNLLHDAGYDIYEAPKAWWLLAPKKPKDISEIKLPEHAAYLYSFLGETWRTYPLTAAPPAALLSSSAKR